MSINNRSQSSTFSVAITGASSGIGRALALRFAKETTHFYLAGRNQMRLEQCRAEILTINPCAIIVVSCFDVGDKDACQKWCDEIFSVRLDILIINAGVALGEEVDVDKHLEICYTNVLGVAHIVFYALEHFSKQTRLENGRKGQIVLMSSIASLLAMPNATSYSASKVFVRYLGESLNVSQDEVCITTICPGVIRTPLTQYLNPIVPQIPCEVATEKMYRAIKKGKKCYIFPLWLRCGARFYHLLPFFLKTSLVKVFNYFGRL
ncbi:short-chain dehydrogenase [Helicobacter monodelphidis]|uniref:SDR family NAD(P)-dependent oxidoreductase n=1 Tax=Helicobacter sp. 15-1451 TaxID=2004995 RepID=UPI000DCDB5FC|nr:SDR family NAD(P)-dependent oxidoreductase [Helicobacter sp. 15-1451]RAX57931.1 short-chain dehydrogenase [Helicobacter sp. 15-1451]